MNKNWPRISLWNDMNFSLKHAVFYWNRFWFVIFFYLLFAHAPLRIYRCQNGGRMFNWTNFNSFKKTSECPKWRLLKCLFIYESEVVKIKWEHWKESVRIGERLVEDGDGLPKFKIDPIKIDSERNCDLFKSEYHKSSPDLENCSLFY